MTYNLHHGIRNVCLECVPQLEGEIVLMEREDKEMPVILSLLHFNLKVK